MKKIMLALVLVTACGADTGGNQQAPAKARVDLSGLQGLYEGKGGMQTDQLCMIGKQPDQASFGIVVWGANLSSCAGSGKAQRQGNVLRLTMAGDQPCELEGRIDGGKLVLGKAPESCSYYCGGGAQLDAAQFEKKGSSVEDALKAKDLVGEPLCGGLSGT